MTRYATETGDTPITIDPNCVATGNSPTVPSSCTTQTVAPDHLLFILENGNLNNNFGSNVETALDIEARPRRRRRTSAMKYYAADCASTTPPGSGLTNAGCNGSDVGLEETIEDAANDPTLHSVSNSWAFGGEAEWGAADPFLLAAENSLTIGAAAGHDLLLLDRRLGHATSPAIRPTARTSSPSAARARTRRSNPATWSTSTDVERRRQLVLERHRPAAVADGRRRHGQRAVPGPRRSRTSRRSPTRTPASATVWTTTADGRHAGRPGRRHEPHGAGA